MAMNVDTEHLRDVFSFRMCKGSRFALFLYRSKTCSICCLVLYSGKMDLSSCLRFKANTIIHRTAIPKRALAGLFYPKIIVVKEIHLV